jgi:hypothetical protein
MLFRVSCMTSPWKLDFFRNIVSCLQSTGLPRLLL